MIEGSDKLEQGFVVYANNLEIRNYFNVTPLNLITRELYVSSFRPPHWALLAVSGVKHEKLCKLCYQALKKIHRTYQALSAKPTNLFEAANSGARRLEFEDLRQLADGVWTLFSGS